MSGLRFRRQHPIGPYFADFYCAAAGLVIEIDGASHQGERKERDGIRDAWMRDRGLRVLRFRADDVLRDIASVLGTIQRVGHEATREQPPPSPKR